MIDIHSFEPLWGAWKIDKLLGSGSYGSVYKAVRREYGQEYWAAIKHVSIPMSEAELQTVYDEGLASDERSARMYYEQLLDNLQEEIQFMCRLKGNTNIVAYEDHLTIPKQEMPGYDIFIRMELLRGLNDIIRTNQLTTAEVCRLGIDICKALELLEREGIVHRDIKPANILRNSMGNYKLGDFGVAKQLEHTHTIMSKKGTYTYMAPEVFKGETASARADIYSLGLVMHRLLNNNKAPFIPVDATHISHTQSEEALMRRMKGAVLPAPVMADAALAEIIGIACAYKPEERFQTAEAFRMALEGYYKNELCSDQPVIVDVPEQKRPENIVEEPHNGEEETPRMIEPTEKLFGGDTTKGGTKPEPVLEPEREYHSDEDGETEADEPVDKPSSLVKRILIGAAAVAAVGLIVALPRAQEADASEENTMVHLDETSNMENEQAQDEDEPLPAGLKKADTIEAWAGMEWPVEATVHGILAENGVEVYSAVFDDSPVIARLRNGDKISVLGVYQDGSDNIFYKISCVGVDGGQKTGYVNWAAYKYVICYDYNEKQNENTFALVTREGWSVNLGETFSKAEYTILYFAHTACDEGEWCATVTQLQDLMKAKEKYDDSLIQVVSVMIPFGGDDSISDQIKYVGLDMQHLIYSDEGLRNDSALNYIYGVPDILIFNRSGCLVSSLFGGSNEAGYSELLSALAEQPN
ncbi:MAG: protein kinase [Clostridia bacterium]|nr:protein kinase [Clostridia bacterium]